MAKVRYTIRLYRRHDLDLITFIETHQFNIIKAMYSSLISFSKDELFVIDVPPKRVYENVEIRKVYVKTLSLDTQKDMEAVEIMNKIAKGYRNNFLKNLLRQYLCIPLTEDFLCDSNDADYFYKKFDIFKKGKRIAKAGKMNKKKSKKELNSFLEEKNSEFKKNNELETNDKESSYKKVAHKNERNSLDECNRENNIEEQNSVLAENNNRNNINDEIEDDSDDITDIFANIIG